MNEIAQQLKKYGGSAWMAFVLIGLVALLGSLFWKLAQLSIPVKGASLPVIAIGGVILLILLLTAVTLIFSILGLANKNQAMGLPDGSIRAVIALSLIVLFAILSVFLYKSVAEPKLNTVAQLSDTERKQFIHDNPNLRDIQSIISKDKDQKQIVARDKDGKLLKNEDGSPQYLFDVSYGSGTAAASDDFAKQLLVLLGTLMTAITSFYLGAGTATSAAATNQAGTAPKPTLSSINPSQFPISNETLHLDILGSDLNTMTNVMIVNAGVQIVGTNVSSNANHVICNLDVSKASAGAWDVIVNNGASISAKLSGTLTLT